MVISTPPPPTVPLPVHFPSPQSNSTPPQTAPDPLSGSTTPVRQAQTVVQSSPVKTIPKHVQQSTTPSAPYSTVPPLGFIGHQQVIYTDKDRTLKFSVFNPSKTSYGQFKALYLLNLKKFDPTASIVFRDHHGLLEFNPRMTMRESELLFLATVKAFKDQIHEIVGDLDLAATDRVAWWQCLDCHYLPIYKSLVEVISILVFHQQNHLRTLLLFHPWLIIHLNPNKN